MNCLNQGFAFGYAFQVIGNAKTDFNFDNLLSIT